MFFFFQAEDGIRDLVRSRGLGDVYKRQDADRRDGRRPGRAGRLLLAARCALDHVLLQGRGPCLLYTSDAADERSSVDLGGRRIIKKKTEDEHVRELRHKNKHANRKTMAT